MSAMAALAITLFVLVLSGFFRAFEFALVAREGMRRPGYPQRAHANGRRDPALRRAAAGHFAGHAGRSSQSTQSYHTSGDAGGKHNGYALEPGRSRGPTRVALPRGGLPRRSHRGSRHRVAASD